MKIRADEHISPKMVKLVREISLSRDGNFSSVYDVNDRGTSDVHWITKFAIEGGEAIITADTDFLKTPPQIITVSNTGLKVIHLPSKWCNSIIDHQAAHLLFWWKKIESTIAEMKQRECYQVPWNFREDAILQKVQINFSTAFKKLRKSKNN